MRQNPEGARRPAGPALLANGPPTADIVSFRMDSSSGSTPVPGFLSPEALLAAIVDSSDDAIVSKDLNGVVTSWNKGAERTFGYTAEEMIGQPILRVIPHDRQSEEPAILERLREESVSTISRRYAGGRTAR